jgi:agmatinase
VVKLFHSNVQSFSQADIIVLGVPDESRSHAKRKGASKGPDSLRRASNYYEFFERDGKRIAICPMSGTLENKKIMDAGNLTRDDLYKMISNIISAKKIPITIGGDHSITTIILKSLNDSLEEKKYLCFTLTPIPILFHPQGTIMDLLLLTRQSISILVRAY